jgi:hypothetical protein
VFFSLRFFMNIREICVLLCGAAVLPGVSVFGAEYTSEFGESIVGTGGTVEVDPTVILKGSLKLDAGSRVVPMPGTEDEWGSVDATTLFPDETSDDAGDGFDVEIKTGLVEHDISIEGPIKDLFDTVFEEAGNADAYLGEPGEEKALSLGGMPFIADCIPIPVDRFTAEPVVIGDDTMGEFSLALILDTFTKSGDAGNLLDGEDYKFIRAATVPEFRPEAGFGQVRCNLCSFSKKTASPLVMTYSATPFSDSSINLANYNRRYEGLLTIAEDKDGTFPPPARTRDFIISMSYSFPRGDINCQVNNLQLRAPITIEKDQIFQIGCGEIVAKTYAEAPEDQITVEKPITVNDGGTIRFSRRPFVRPEPSTEPAGG